MPSAAHPAGRWLPAHAAWSRAAVYCQPICNEPASTQPAYCQPVCNEPCLKACNATTGLGLGKQAAGSVVPMPKHLASKKQESQDSNQRKQR